MPGAPLSLSEREEIALALTEDPQVSRAQFGRRSAVIRQLLLVM